MLETIYLCYISYLYHFPWIPVKWITFSTWISYDIVNLVFPNLDSPTYFPLPFLPVTSHIFSISINSFQGIFVQNFRATPTHSFFFGFSPLYLISHYGWREVWGNISDLWYICLHCSFGSSNLANFLLHQLQNCLLKLQLLISPTIWCHIILLLSLSGFPAQKLPMPPLFFLSCSKSSMWPLVFFIV